MTNRRIPLFPLNTVLFPGMSLPLHIFEPRYQEMIGRCLERDRRFGVCLIRSGPEVGGPAEPHPVGTTCEIVSVARLPEGRMNLTTVGRERFRIVRLHHGAAYLDADIEPLEEEAGANAVDLAAQVREGALLYIRTLLAAGGEEAPVLELPADPVVLSYLVGAVLQVPPEVRQSLLEEDRTGARLERQLALLGEETGKLAIAFPHPGRRARPFRIDPERISPN